MAAIIENILFLCIYIYIYIYSIIIYSMIMVQLLRERRTKEGTGIPEARTVCLFYNQNASYI